MNSSRVRGRFEGVWHIVQFNWPFYIMAFAAMAALITTALRAPIPAGLASFAVLGAIAAGWLVVVSLVASHWVYDRSPLCHWKWVCEFIREPRKLVNVHAGFDESSDALRALFSDSELLIFDFYDPQKSPEASIARARQTYPPSANAQRISPTQWPLPDTCCDAVFLLLAAHELRARPDRIGFFIEARRVITAGGRLVLVEHLRDLPNFLVFGPGFLHFLPRSEWLFTIKESRFKITREFSITPFVRVFILDPEC